MNWVEITHTDTINLKWYHILQIDSSGVKIENKGIIHKVWWDSTHPSGCIFFTR